MSNSSYQHRERIIKSLEVAVSKLRTATTEAEMQTLLRFIGSVAGHEAKKINSTMDNVNEV